MTANANAQSLPKWVDGLQRMIDDMIARIDRLDPQRTDADDVSTRSAYETAALPKQRQAVPPRRNSDLDAGKVSLTTSGQRADAMLREARAFYNKLSRTLTPEERNQIAAARTRADSVYAMHARPVPETLPGETPRGYRARLASGLQDFSPNLTRTNLDALPDSALTLAEDRVYQDAIEAARRPNVIPTGTLRARTYRDEATGHKITEYHGDPMAWLR
ncbi:MAG: hypothetical protein M0038_06850, partial [Pseudomonadota bacterium]|nr:hypothetical protein [Pseudomonadota bacterium]